MNDIEADGSVGAEDSPTTDGPLAESSSRPQLTEDGGRGPGLSWGWLVVFGQGVTLFAWGGFLKGMGVLLPSVTADLTQNTAVTGEILAAAACVKGILGPLAGPIGDRFGWRPVVMVMSFIAAIGIISASLAKTTTGVAISLIGISGVGFSAPFILTKAMLGRYFHDRYALAVSMGSIGDALAVVLVPPLLQILLETYGWRGALLLYGGLCLHLVAMGAFLKEPPIQDGDQQGGYAAIPNNEASSSTQAADDTASKSRMILRSFNFSMLKKLVFWEICLVMLGTSFVGLIWYVYFVPHLEAKGFDASEAIGFVVAAGVGQVVSKVLLGKLIVHGMVSVRAGLVLSIATCSLTLALDPLINSFWPMLVATIICGSSLGLMFCLMDVFAKEIAGADGLASALGYIDLISGIARLCFGFIPGFIYEQTGSYDVAFMVTGFGYFTLLLPVIAEWLMHRYYRPS